MSAGRNIVIAGRQVGENAPIFIVAELSGNHHQSFDTAVKLIRAAAEAGVNAIKLQTYTPDTMTIACNKEWFLVGGENNPEAWKGKTLHQLYRTAYTPWEWQPKLKKITEDLGMLLFSTPFDPTAVDFLESMNVPCYKIASYEANDIPLLKKVAATGKPVILSIGYASLEDTQLAIDALRARGARDIAVLHCVTSYSENPNPEDSNLKTLLDIRERFQVVSGFSDNNAGIEIPIVAAIMGASIIEKHFILRRAEGGPDAGFSIEPEEMKAMITRIRRAEKMMGKVHYGPMNDTERYNLRYRRSLFVVRDIKQGEKFTAQNIRSIRPAHGLHSKFLDEILGKRAAADLERGTPLSWDLIAS